ncbi:MAG: radical SAM protein [Deltaproteobacteria bacterium]|nr:radical SAM protein [Deltaproteobacteria bacterium]
MLEYAKGMLPVLLKLEKAWNQPITINVDTSSACNLSCKMCFRSQDYYEEKQRIFLTTATLHKLYDQFQPKILIFGGITAEPLMNKEIGELVAIAHSHKSRTIMSTNGQLMSEEKAYTLIRNGINLVKFSVDAATPATYQKIRGSDFDHLVGNIRRFIAIQKELKISRQLARLDFVIQKDNLDDIIPFLKLNRDLGLHFAGFLPVNFKQFTQESVADFRQGYNVAKIISILRKAADKAREYGVKTNLEALLRGADKIGAAESYEPAMDDYYLPWYKYTRARDYLCLYPWLQLAVLVNGDVSICCDTFGYNVFNEGGGEREKGLVLGNIHHDDLRALWNGKKLRMIRRMFKNGENLQKFKSCKGCIYKLNIFYEIRMNNLFSTLR